MNSSTLQKEQSEDLKTCLKTLKITVEADPTYILDILYPAYRFKDFHRQWFRQSLQPFNELCLGPRNHAKTTVRAVAKSIYRLTQDPNYQIGIVSDTEGQAVKFLSEAKLHLERNKFLLQTYPHLKPGKLWSSKELTIRGATKIQKGGNITAFGYGGGTGSEFDEIIIDDIVDFENSLTKYQRDKLESWINISVLPMLKPHGRVSYNGTRYHNDDLYGRLIKKGTYNNQQFNSHKAIQDDGTALWPEQYSIERLLKIKEEIGSIAFNSQYQNDTKLMEEGKIFKREWFKYFRKETIGNDEYFIREDGKRIAKSDIQCYQDCDLAISKKDTADYFVILTFGVDKEGNFYLFHLLRGRFSWNEQKSITPQNYHRNLPLNWLGIEDTQYQVVLIQELNSRGDMSIRRLKAIGDKITRANAISAKFETGKVWIWDKLPHREVLESELTSFPEGTHDDIVDVVSYMPQCIRQERAKLSIH